MQIIYRVRVKTKEQPRRCGSIGPVVTPRDGSVARLHLLRFGRRVNPADRAKVPRSSKYSGFRVWHWHPKRSFWMGVHINHLWERPFGIFWIALEGPNTF